MRVDFAEREDTYVLQQSWLCVNVSISEFSRKKERRAAVNRMADRLPPHSTNRKLHTARTP